MIAELVGAKMLAPLYGSSLYVWGSVIGITLISLTSGYYIGGLLSYSAWRRKLIYWGLLAAALMIATMPWLAEKLVLSMENLDVISAILLSTSLYLLPPLVLLGATSPLIIAAISTDLSDAGKAAGTVYAISTVGGILATFLSGFYLIPEFGLTSTALAAGTALSVIPLILLLRIRHYPAVAVPVLLLLMMVPQQRDKDYPVQVQYRSEGLLGQLMLVDVPMFNRETGARRTDRILFVNRMGQTWINLDTGEPIWQYPKYLTTISSVLPRGSRVLLLGLGGGIVARELQKIGLEVDSVELDARIAMIARKYFGLERNGRIVVDDGRHYLRSTRETYDLIIFDVFKAEVPPAHMLSVETFREVQDRLNPGGFMIVNYNGFLTGSVGKGGRSILKTIRTAGYDVRLAATGGSERARNSIFIGTTTDLDFSNPRIPLKINGRIQSLASKYLDVSKIDTKNAVVLRDNRPVLENLNLEAAEIWRKDYTNIYTKRFIAMGIPLFE